MLNGNNIGGITLAHFIDECEINQWVMRHSEIKRIAQYCDVLKSLQWDAKIEQYHYVPKSLQGEVRVAQIGNDKGFTAKLLSDEGLLVKAIQAGVFEDEVINAYQGKKLVFEGGSMFNEARTYKRCPVIFPTDEDASMSYFANSRPFGRKKDYTWMIIHLRVLVDQVTPPDYVRLDDWETYRVGDLCDISETSPKPKSQIAVFVREDLRNKLKDSFDAVKQSKMSAFPYNWEKEMPPLGR